MFFKIFLNENKRLSRLEKQEVQKFNELTFFKEVSPSGFATKLAIFPSFCLLGNIGQENV